MGSFCLSQAIQTFLCKNCQYQQHQCFACGLLGSSDKSCPAEVFPCISATCGHFYHPKCVSKLLYPWDKIQAEELQKKIAEGESFTCPVHKCYHCKQVEDKKVHELQFGICRRCPKAYHRKCLPRSILFERDINENVQRRAWDGLLQNRILIYCLDHKIIPKIGTPRRDHLVFPDVDMRKQQHAELLPAKVKTVSGRRSKVLGSLEAQPALKADKPFKGTYGTFRSADSIKQVERRLPKVSEPDMGQSLISSDYSLMYAREKVCKPSTVEKGKLSRRNDQSKSMQHLRLSSKMQNIPDDKTKSIPAVKPAMNKAYGTLPSAQTEMEERMLALMKSSTSSFNPENFKKEKGSKCINLYSAKSFEDKTITMGKVERSVKAIRVALEKFDDGGSIEDAKAICEPEILNQIKKWKRKLKVYLAPFLHGMRYTSFGRHFTKVEKLKEVVKRLQWYVQDGDTIVDFCCGSNDFSCLMKESLDKLGIRALFKNYDLIQPKNDFNFEKRDWMNVHIGELDAGSNLIMGLNPPFGVQASLANKFITKALTFSPKLLILIVPKETERLDKKRFPYDLIWRDDEIFSGKSFYLPGSVDVHELQMEQWNLVAPPLYLWSHPHWTAKHRAIARHHGHIRINQDVGDVMGVNDKIAVSNYLMEDNHDCYGDFSNVVQGYGNITHILDDLPEGFDEF